MLNKIKIICILSLVMVGCISLPPTSNLQDPKLQTPIGQTVVIDRIVIPELSDTYRKSTEDNMTLNLKDFLVKGNYFDKTLLFVDKEGDLKNYQTFQINFTKYEHFRRPYEWYFPLAIITLTFYIWFGGAVTIDETHYACVLKVKDEQNKLVYTIQKEKKGEKEINIYSAEKMFPTGTETRTLLITELLEEYKKQRKTK